MQIKGPSAPGAIDIEVETIRPTTPVTAASATSTPKVPASTLQLSPALFQIGQLLEVVVAKIEQNMLLLTLQNPVLDENGQRLNLQLRAPASSPAQVGQQLMVQVKNIENGVPQLQVLATRAEPLNVATALLTAQQQQAPLPPLLANLAQLQQAQSKSQFEQLPALVRERIQSLWRALADTSQIQRPAGLKQAMNYSGPFLESALLKIAQGQARNYPAMDVQTGLLRLADAIRAQLEAQPTANATTTSSSTPQLHPSLLQRGVDSALPPTVAKSSTSGAVDQTNSTTDKSSPAATDNKPPHPQIPQAQARAAAMLNTVNSEHLLEQLLRQTEGGLARILTQQLHALNHDPQRPTWLLELPVRHDDGVDMFDLRIQRDAEEKRAGPAPAQHTWTVMLAFELEGLGPIRAQISLLQDQISSFWWAEQPDTVALFHQHIDQLYHRITAAGLKVNKLNCQCGIPQLPPMPRNVPISDIMLDEKI